MAASEGVKLLGELKARAADVAIFGSFNVNFGFFEQVVSHALQSKGCHHQILLMDASQCAEAMGDPDLSPKRAGSEYCLVPVRAAGAFHPKFILLIGRQQTRLFIGSHNLTLSGFGLNREVSNVVVARPDDGTRALVAAVWRFAREWTAKGNPELAELIDAAKNWAPWLSQPLDEPGGLAALSSLPEGPSLWQQLVPHLEAGVARATILGPYFDQRLTFVKAVAEHVRGGNVTVGISPQHSELPDSAAKLVPAARFVDLSGWDGVGDRLVHAKVLLFDLLDGSSVLVSGSANPSDPAWLAPPSQRNAELVVVRHLPQGSQVPTELGLRALAELPQMSAAAWQVVAQRANERGEPASVRGARSVWVALDTGQTLEAPAAFGELAHEVDMLDGDGESIGRAPVRVNAGTATIATDGETRQRAALLVGGEAQAVVHHITELRELALDEKRRSLRSALLDLDSADAGLDRLIAIIERAILDGEPPPAPSRARGSVVATQDAAKGTAVVAVGDLPAKARKRARIAAGDLALVLDTLIRRLGQGLFEPHAAPGAVSEEEITAATLLPDKEPSKVDGVKLAALCRKKTGTLMRRMLKRLTGKPAQEQPSHTIVQLGACLGLLRQLRAREQNLEWLEEDDELIEFGEQWRFFKDAATAVFKPGGVAASAVAEVGEVFDELPTCAALLAWSAYSSNLDGTTAFVPVEFGADDEDVESASDETLENLVGIALLLRCLDQELPPDAELEPLFGPAGLEWLRRHRGWAQGLHTASPRAGAPLRKGAVVRCRVGSEVVPAVVIDVVGENVEVADGSGETRSFRVGYVRVVGDVREIERALG